jgi:predicted nucleotidyltransferase/HEPN domain-containing protein
LTKKLDSIELNAKNIDIHMKTTLPERSLVIKERLDNIVKEILAVAKDKIAMIILFGSYARGTWVQDAYREGHIVYTYRSDLDILLVLRKSKHRGNIASRMELDIRKRLEKRGLVSPPMKLTYPPSVEDAKEAIKDPCVSLIAEPIARINKELERKQYFFTDIKNEGILLYDNGEFELADARSLPWEERKKIAKEDYENWFTRGCGFLIGGKFYLERNDNALSAFLLHQTTESFYNAILLVFTGYKDKEHNILDLGMKARNYHHELFRIFPYATAGQVECFELLMRAYIEARYNKNYRISKEQLLYLIERVEMLHDMTKSICLEYINRANG